MIKGKQDKPKRPSRREISAYMCSLGVKRWKRYAERVAQGEISAENYVYRPRGPMSPQSKAKRDFTRWKRQIANAQLVRLALDGEKLTKRQWEQIAEKAASQRRRRLHLRFGGRAPKYRILHADLR